MVETLPTVDVQSAELPRIRYKTSATPEVSSSIQLITIVEVGSFTHSK